MKNFYVLNTNNYFALLVFTMVLKFSMRYFEFDDDPGIVSRSMNLFDLK